MKTIILLTPVLVIISIPNDQDVNPGTNFININKTPVSLNGRP
jgi:hypothetical protein